MDIYTHLAHRSKVIAQVAYFLLLAVSELAQGFTLVLSSTRLVPSFPVQKGTKGYSRVPQGSKPSACGRLLVLLDRTSCPWGVSFAISWSLSFRTLQLSLVGAKQMDVRVPTKRHSDHDLG